MMVTAVARPMQLSERVAQGFNLPFVGILLPLGQFERFENLFHIVERLLKGRNDVIDFLDGSQHGGR